MFFYFGPKMTPVKQGVKKPKQMDFSPRAEIKITKPLIKNPSRYVFYNFDKIKKNFCFHFGPRMTHVWIFHKKTPKFHPFSNFKCIKMCRNFCTENFFSPKSANVHIFELLKRWGPMANLKAKYKNSLGGGEAFPPYLHKPDYSH